MAQGTACLAFEAKRGRTALGEVYQRDPLRFLFPRAGAGEPLTGALTTTSGGLVGGDRLDIRVRGGDGTAGRVMAQAAEKIYRTTGPEVAISIRLQAEAGAWLEWLPQETIVFEAARLRRTTCVDVAAEARVLCGEMLAFGRAAMGERLTQGLVHEAWEVRRDGRLAWSDVLRLDRDLEGALQAPVCLDGARACASTIYVGADAPARLAWAREWTDRLDGGDALRASASCIGTVLVVRWLGRSGAALRRAYGRFWAEFRHQAAGYPPIMPRLWNI